ncbi:MAG: hypothetical protein HWE07_00720 [Cytophagia bacterium]|nr:hypothetical protein [Cytophagia bacterium]
MAKKNNQLAQAEQYFSNFSTTAESKVDNQAEEEKKELFSGSLDNIEDWLKHEHFRLEKKDKDSERDLRKKNANRSFWFSVCWALFIGSVIMFKGFCSNFKFSETEYITTIGTLSVTILTYYLTVVKSIFPNK